MPFRTLCDAAAALSFRGAAAALAGIVGLYAMEVVARYLFDAPTTWSGEWVGYLLLAMIFLAAPEITRRGGHIAIDLLVERLSPTGARRLHRATAAAAALVCAATAAIATDQAWTQAARDVMTNAAHPIPRWGLTALIAYGFGFSALFFLRTALSPSAQAEARP